MACPQSLPNSPNERLLEAVKAFSGLPLDAAKEEVEVCFDQVRVLLLDVMLGAPDSHPYESSWNTLTRSGDFELDALMGLPADSPAYGDSLAHLKHLVELSMNTLP